MNDYTLIIHFSNGEKKAFDFSSLFDKGICHKLKDKAYFRNFRIDPFTIDWNNEIGFAPEFLYEYGLPFGVLLDKFTRETMILGRFLNKNVYLCRIKREYFIEWN